jgi:hypothetical protein
MHEILETLFLTGVSVVTWGIIIGKAIILIFLGILTSGISSWVHKTLNELGQKPAPVRV